MSDRTARPPTINDRVNDCLAVMDAEGIDSAHIVGFSEGSNIAVAMASRCPDRVRSVLLQGGALLGVAPEEIEAFWEEGDPPIPAVEEVVADLLESWGKNPRSALKWWAPDAIGNERIEAWYAKFQRQSASPGTLLAHIEASSVGDLTAEFDEIACPIMVAHCRFDPLVPVAWARYLAARRPDAELRLWDSRNHVAELDPKWEESQAEYIEWVLGIRPQAGGKTKFAVVLFTDIVGSTGETIRHGDRDWSHRMAAHDELADKIIGAHDGRRVKSTGDGMLAVFSDPGQALAAALRFQDEIGSIGLQVRAGVHAGQVEEQSDGDVLGIAVVTAARLEGCAPTGSVAVSRSMSDMLVGDARFRFESIGTSQLSGIEEPVPVFLVERN